MPAGVPVATTSPGSSVIAAVINASKSGTLVMNISVLEDCTMAEWFKACGRPFSVVANKLDKLKKSEIEGNLLRIRETLELNNGVKVIPFSAEKGEGRQELLGLISSHAGESEL